MDCWNQRYKFISKWKASGSGVSLIHSNGITISNWQGTFTTYSGEQITFKGRDINKNGKFVVLRTYFTDSSKISWYNGLVCLLDGHFDPQDKSFKCEGYELMWHGVGRIRTDDLQRPRLASYQARQQPQYRKQLSSPIIRYYASLHKL